MAKMDIQVRENDWSGQTSYYTDEEGNRLSIGVNDLPKFLKDSQNAGRRVEKIPTRTFRDRQGNDFIVPEDRVRDFFYENTANKRDVAEVQDWENGKGERMPVTMWKDGEADRQAMRKAGFRPVSEWDDSNYRTKDFINSVNHAFTHAEDWGVQRNEDGSVDWGVSAAEVGERLVRGIGGAAAGIASGAANMVGDAAVNTVSAASRAVSGLADLFGMDGTADAVRGFRKNLKGSWELNKHFRHADIVDGILGETITQGTNLGRGLADIGVGGAETYGEMALGLRGIAAAGGKFAVPAAFGVGGFEGTIDDPTVKAVGAKGYGVAVAKGLGDALAGSVLGKILRVTGLKGADRQMQKTFGKALAIALGESVEGGAAMGLMEGVGQAARAVAGVKDTPVENDGEQEVQLREATVGERVDRAFNAFMHGTLMTLGLKAAELSPRMMYSGRGMTKAVTFDVENARKEYAPKIARVAEAARAMQMNGEPISRGPWFDDVKGVSTNGEVFFKDGSVYYPATKDRAVSVTGQDGQQSVATVKGREARIVVSDGTILNAQGDVVGKLAGGQRMIGRSVDTQAESYARATDPDASQEITVFDRNTGRASLIPTNILDIAPDSYKAYNKWILAGNTFKAPELDADGLAFGRIIGHFRMGGDARHAAEMALGDVQAGRKTLREAADLLDQVERSMRGEDPRMNSRAQDSADSPEEKGSGVIPAADGRVAVETTPGKNGELPRTTVEAAADINELGKIGAIKTEPVDVTQIETSGETDGNVETGDTAEHAPIVLRLNPETGKLEAVDGNKRIAAEKANGAKTVEAIVLHEEDGWSAENAEAVKLVGNLTSGNMDAKGMVDAFGKLGIDADTAKEKGIIGQGGDVESQLANNKKGAALNVAMWGDAELKAAVTDGNLTAISEIVQRINSRTWGKDWQQAQRAAFYELDGLDTTSRIRALEMIRTVQPFVESGEINWRELGETARYYATHYDELKAAGITVRGLPGFDLVAMKMSEDSMSRQPVETEDGKITTVADVEARHEPSEGQPSGVRSAFDPPEETDAGLKISIREEGNGANVFGCSRFPEMKIEAGGNLYSVTGITPEELVDPRNREDFAQIFGKLFEQAAANANGQKVEISFPPECRAQVGMLLDLYDHELKTDPKMKGRIDSVLKVLEKSGLASGVVMDQESFDAALIGKGYQELQADGKTYGFTDGQNVYLNPKFFNTLSGLNTTIHEFGHLGIIATKRVNRALYDRGIELVKKTAIWKELQNAPDYKDENAERLADEALTRIIAERGEGLGAETPKGVVAAIKNWLVEFWGALGKGMGIRDLTPERIEKMSVEDIADAIRAEMMSGRAFGTNELSLGAGDVKAKILRFAKYRNPTSKAAKASFKAVKDAWKSLSEEEKARIGEYGNTDVLKTKEAKQISSMVERLRSWDKLREKMSRGAKEQARRTPNAGQQKIITGSPDYYVANVTEDVTSPFAYILQHKMPIPGKGDFGYDAWHRLTDGMDKEQRRELARFFGGKYYKHGGTDTVLRDYAQFLGIDWAGSDDFELKKGSGLGADGQFEEFLNEVMKEKTRFEEWRAGDRKTRAEMDAEADGARAYDAIANGEPPMGLRSQNKKDAAIAMAKMAELARDGKLPESVEAFDTGANQKTYVKFSYGDGSEFRIYGDAKSITAWAEKVRLKRTASARRQENGMTDDEFAAEDEWVRNAQRVEAERMDEQDDLSDMPDFKRPIIQGSGNEKSVFNGPRAWAEGSSNGVPDSQSDASPLRLRRKSGGTAQIVPNDGKKVKARIQKFNNRDFRIDTGNDRPVGAIVKSMCKALGLRQKGSYNSHYGIFETPDGKVAFRLSGHTAEGENFRKNGTQRNTSVVIQMYDLQHGETTFPFEEFVYPKDVFNANREKVVAAIMNGVGKMIDTGKFEDSSGLATYTDHKGIMLSRSGLYTGSAADYEKPSLLKVGTGEGSQVYGWGLYASDKRSVAEAYSGVLKNTRTRPVYLNGKRINGEKVSDSYNLRDGFAMNVIRDYLEASGDADPKTEFTKTVKKWRKLNPDNNDYKDLEQKWNEIKDKITVGKEPSEHVYEQTFFTNRAPGDESHLLKWYEPVSEEQKKWILAEAEKEGFATRPSKGFGNQLLALKFDLNHFEKAEDLYEGLSLGGRLGSPKAASEFLARADIDGIKYPVDSYGGKTVKDGDKAGWNYVSFRDDNIRVDHKWRDGEMLFARPVGVDRSMLVFGKARVAEDAGVGEQTPGAIAASRELSNQPVTPIRQAGQMRKMSLPLSDLEWLRKELTGNHAPAHIASRLPGGANSASTRGGKLVIAADVFGMVDKTDMEVNKTFLKSHGYFKNEDPTWCLTATPSQVRAEKRRSEDQLANQLLSLMDRRTKGTPGGESAARAVFADELANIVMEMRHVPTAGAVGAVRTIGDGVRSNVLGQFAGLAGGAQGDAVRDQAAQFLDWAYGAPAAGAPATRDLPAEKLTNRMFGAFLVMPGELENRAPEWSRAINDAIASTPKLLNAWRELSRRAMSEQSFGAVQRQMMAALDRQTEVALRQLKADANEPIGAWSAKADAKEQFLVGFHDRMAPVAVRIDEKVRIYRQAKEAAIKATNDPALKAQIQAELSRFIGDVDNAVNQLELSRIAYERGTVNEGKRYFIRELMLVNEATERSGLTLEEMAMYLDLQRGIETQGRANSYGMTPRQNRLALQNMKLRLGPQKWWAMERFAGQWWSIHDQEFLEDKRLLTAFGKSYVDYLKTQSHYVTTKRTWSPEELADINAARAAAKRAGVAGGDDVIEQMFKFAGSMGMGSGEGLIGSRLKGSFAAKENVMAATWEKVDRSMQFLRRNQYVIDMRNALISAGVEGVRDVARGTTNFQDGKRYGFLNYLENGQKRALIVPRQIADGFNRDMAGSKIYSTLYGGWRKLIIDWNPSYWNRNIARNSGSIEKNMPGMRESWLKTTTRALGLGNVVDTCMQHLVRHVPAAGRMFSEDTVFGFIPKAKRMATLLEDPSKWQQQLWRAQDAGDTEAVATMQADLNETLNMLKGNMLVPMRSAYEGKEVGFVNDILGKKSLKTIQRIREEAAARTKGQKALDAATWVFRRTARQQMWEDDMAKITAYLHDRMKFGGVRTVQETGRIVAENVSIGQGERSGTRKKLIQNTVATFFNMVEKGLVRNAKAHLARPGEMFRKDAKVWTGTFLGALVTTGVMSALIRKIFGDDDEKIQASPLGSVYDYCEFVRKASKNYSTYLKENYNAIPIWTSPTGKTTLVIAMPWNDEDKVIVPGAQFAAQFIAARMGISAEQPSAMEALMRSSVKAITPDLALAGPAWTLLRDVPAALFLGNPTDFFSGRKLYDESLYESRSESPEMAGRFALEMGMQVWNDLGGRVILQPDRNGIDGRKEELPQFLDTIMNKIPVVSPFIRSFLKVQTGDIDKYAKPLTEAEQKRQSLFKVLRKDAEKRSTPEESWFMKDSAGYEKQIQNWTETYKLSTDEVGELRDAIAEDWLKMGPEKPLHEIETRMSIHEKARKQGVDPRWITD